jgi:hypothetical protein
MRIEIFSPLPQGHQAQKSTTPAVRIGGEKYLPGRETAEIIFDYTNGIGSVTDVCAVPSGAEDVAPRWLEYYLYYLHQTRPKPSQSANPISMSKFPETRSTIHGTRRGRIGLYDSQ